MVNFHRQSLLCIWILCRNLTFLKHLLIFFSFFFFWGGDVTSLFSLTPSPLGECHTFCMAPYCYCYYFKDYEETRTRRGRRLKYPNKHISFVYSHSEDTQWTTRNRRLQITTLRVWFIDTDTTYRERLTTRLRYLRRYLLSENLNGIQNISNYD